MSLDDKNLKQLFKLADEMGKKRYHRLTHEDFQDALKFDHWRYVQGDSECGTTRQSKQWVHDNSEQNCPVCGHRFNYQSGHGKTIDHKLVLIRKQW